MARVRGSTMFLVAAIGGAAFARAQCPPQWSNRLGGSGLYDSVDNSISCLRVFDDDGGGPRLPALYAGGRIFGGPALTAYYVARWDGYTWSSLGSGTNGPVEAFTEFDDDGPGPHAPALIAGGYFDTAGGVGVHNIAKWNGATWSPLGLGTDITVTALAVYDDDGDGPHLPALYAAGNFSTAGGQSALRIAKWDGVSWSPLGEGLGWVVSTLAVFDEDGDGPGLPALFAGGWFETAGGAEALHIARWDGSAWSAVGGGMNGNVSALTVFDDDGSGPHLPALYAGGDFTTAGGVDVKQVAKWDGTSWSALAAGFDLDSADVFSLGVYDDDGVGPHPAELYAGGFLIRSPFENGPYIMKWNGASWSEPQLGVDDSVMALAPFDIDGAGPEPEKLYAGGFFRYAVAGGASGMIRIGTWDGESWAKLDRGLSGPAAALCVFDPDGSGPNPSLLGVGGGFLHAGPIDQVFGIAAWGGSAWSRLGSLPLGVLALTLHDADGSGPGAPALHAGMAGEDPYPNGVFAFDGVHWAPVGPIGFDGDVRVLASFRPGAGSDPPFLYAGGAFTGIDGVNAKHVAKWTGAAWTRVGTGMDDDVDAFAIYDDDGEGPHAPVLVAGGRFTVAGNVGANRIAGWDGTSWSPLGDGLNGEVRVLYVFDEDGDGPNPPALYAGGDFTTAGAVQANRIAKWDGSAWSALGSGMNDRVRAMTAFDEDGSGPLSAALYAAGDFTTAGGSHAGGLARWSGTAWSAYGAGFAGQYPYSPSVAALATFDDDGDGPLAPALYAAGFFNSVDGIFSTHIARYSACEGGSVATFCAGDGSGKACPCANSGASGHGCDNSSATGGAILTFTGSPSVADSTLVLTSAGEKPTALSTFWQGTTSVASLHYGDGLRCFGGAMKRLYSVNASGGVVTAPSGGQPSIPVRSAALGNTIAPGSTRYYQTSYRDPDAAFCPQPSGNTFNVSSGLVVLWGP